MPVKCISLLLGIFIILLAQVTSSKSSNEVFTSSFLVRFKKSVDNQLAHEIAKRNSFHNIGPVSILWIITYNWHTFHGKPCPLGLIDAWINGKVKSTPTNFCVILHPSSPSPLEQEVVWHRSMSVKLICDASSWKYVCVCEKSVHVNLKNTHKTSVEALSLSK